ncbi:RHS repeat-associated core domain-containing protein [Roseibacillus ishigakijimensis]|uniref:Teneurin-like YD-shell domain-containing protein n=1 Tax=Roseibacillus ishigakijimensis TaxID=454146 RepID=A0A934VLY6_9BACT|nr:RHS repeat-associated core domain-containing protein [Roseibacillus ishigakijimensis]MBK1833566.1 hypothetical protein [Roseibacillus ishigakijimensis]
MRALLISLFLTGLSPAQTTGQFFLESNQLEAWQWDLDPDGDGLTTRSEYYAGTDPFDANSRLYPIFERQNDNFLLSWNTTPYSRFQVVASPDLQLPFEPVPDSAVLATGSEESQTLTSEEPRYFFAVEPLPSLDQDNDGLSDREEVILGTDITDEDTDGDTVSDGREIFFTMTDPLIFDPTGGTIQGTVYLTADLSGDLTDATPIAGTTVFLDRNFNGRLDEEEPRQLTDDDGSYSFTRLSPGLYEVRQVLRAGDTQTLPVEEFPVLPDGLADEVVDYTHAPGSLPEAYGFFPLDNYPALDVAILGRELQTVDPDLLLLPIGARPVNPPIGSFPRAHHLSLPENASVTVRFDETIVDLEGPDFLVAVPRNGNQARAGEPASYFLGPDESNLIEYDQEVLLGASQGFTIPVDLADFPELSAVRVIRVVSQTSGEATTNNSDGGYGLAGFQALNYLPLNTSAHRVEITGTETFDRHFGRFFQDLPPAVLVQSDSQAQVGQALTLTFIASDDLGTPGLSAIVNGNPVVLDENHSVTFTPGFAGELRFSATATDSGGQMTTEDWTFIVLDENGELPYDPQALAEQQGAGTIDLRLFSPQPGEVPTANLTVVGSVIPTNGTEVNWSLELAPIDDIDLTDISIADPDYVSLATGNTAIYSDALGDLNIDDLDPGIYFLRLSATPAAGGLSNFLGQAIGIGVEEAALRPVVEIITPEHDSTAAMVQEVIASLQSERDLTEWTAEVAPYEEVDPAAVGADSAAWTEIASGSEAFTESSIGTIDTTGLRNGRYLLRLTAFNDLRLGRVEAVEFEVAGIAKPGRNRQLFTDASIELAGFPLQIERVYDSLNAGQSGDFGYGWSLSVGDPDLFETVPNTGATLFGASPFRVGTRVYLTAPNGQRIAFTFQPEFAAGGPFGAIYRATFVPDPGNPYQLEVPERDRPFLSLTGSGDVTLNFVPFPWNPDTYLLTEMNGTVHTIHQENGLLASENTSGTGLRYGPEGITHTSGLALTFARDEAGRITTITQPDGGVWSYSYDANGDLASVLPPAQVVATTFAYDPTFAHYLTSVTDPAGRMGRRFSYDEDGRLAEVYDEFGNKEEQSWDPLARSGTLTSPRGFVTTLLYDDRGNVIEETDPLGKVTTRVYEDERHPDLETEVRTENTRRRTRYNEAGLAEFIDFAPEGSIFSTDLRLEYDSFGNLTREQSIGGRNILKDYDELGRLIRERGYAIPNLSERILTYSDSGALKTETRNGEEYHVTYYDETGLMSRLQGLEGFDRSYHYDELGRPLLMINSLGEEISFSYDDSTASSTVTYPNGATIANSYAEMDGEGIYTETDAFGETRTELLDSDFNLLSETMKNGVTVPREFDASRNMTGITVPGGHENTFTFDALERETSFTDANGQTATTSYDAEGRVSERVNRNGKRITYTYNEYSQIASEAWHEGEEIIRQFDYSYFGSTSRLSSVSDGDNVWSFSSSNIGGIPDSFTFAYQGQDDFTLGYIFLQGRTDVPSRLTLSPGISVRSSFVGPRPYGFNYEIPPTPDGAGGTTDFDVSVRMRYDAEGNQTAIERYNVYSTSDFYLEPVSRSLFTRLPGGALGSISHQNSLGELAFPESEVTFTRDLADQILTRAQAGNTSTFAYDVMGQLTSATHTAFDDESFTYDLAGNDISGDLSTYGADNRLLTRGDLSFDYDNEGNIISQRNTVTGAETLYSYDHRNQLTTVATRPDQLTDATVIAEFAYDYLGRQMSRTIAGTTTYLLWDREHVFAEFSEGATEINKMYLYNLAEPLERYGEWTPQNGTRFYLTDQIGSVNGILARDGNPLHWVDYDSFGNPRGTVPADFASIRFAGRHFYEDLGLYDNQRRHYNPALRRFQQQDPIRYQGGDYNLYRYVNNNPLSFTDPAGTAALTEYGLLVRRVGKCVKNLRKFSKCVDQIFGESARIIAEAVSNGGGGGKVDVSCLSKILIGANCAR